jgi:hypothetical protein
MNLFEQMPPLAIAGVIVGTFAIIVYIAHLLGVFDFVL